MRAFPSMPALAVFVLLAPSTAAFAASDPLECTCRAPGGAYGLGQKVCLFGPQGWRMATCVMALNNTSWRFGDTPCSVSRLESRKLACLVGSDGNTADAPPAVQRAVTTRPPSQGQPSHRPSTLLN